MTADAVVTVIGAVMLALIASILAPSIMGWAKGRAEKETLAEVAAQAKIDRDQEAADRRAEKQQDWDRQDVVAARAEAAATRLMESQAALLISSQERASAEAASAEAITGQLKNLDEGQKINHALLNSNMTSAMQADLDGKRLLLLALKRNSELENSTQDSLDLILITEAKIVDLETALDERAVTQRAIDAQLPGPTS